MVVAGGIVEEPAVPAIRVPHPIRECFLDAGVICEEGPPEQIFGEQRNERTRIFLKRIIEAGRSRGVIRGRTVPRSVHPRVPSRYGGAALL
jgi:hypothetical protein